MIAHAAAVGPLIFVLGVWVQPAETMDVWKARGVNTLVEAPEGHDVSQWAKAADRKGLFQIRKPTANLRLDIDDPHLLAWSTKDEPSNNSVMLDYGFVTQDPAKVQQQAAPWRAAAKAQGRFVPIWTNHVGPHIYPDWARNNALMRDYMEGPKSDWLSADAYPIQDHKPFVIQSNDGYTSTTQGVILDRQIAWSGGKPVMTFIATSAFSGGSPLPTTAQFNAMAWSSVIHGAVGIIYFPVRLAPWTFDATPTYLAKAITAFDREISSLGKVLINPVSGGRRPYTVFRAANQGAAPKALQLPYPFEACEIATKQGPFRIVLNLSDKDQVLDKPEWGLNHAIFHAFDVRRGYQLNP